MSDEAAELPRGRRARRTAPLRRGRPTPGESASLAFYGAAGSVTGAKFLIDTGEEAALIDCGLFQGLKELRLRNWQEPPFDPRRLGWVFLSHAHIDHSGYLPRLVAAGFGGRILCTAGTADLLQVMLRDAAKLQEEEAAYANRKGFSKHRPALPLYTVADAERALARLQVVSVDTPRAVSPQMTVTFGRMGHILGAASVTVDVRRRGAHNRVVYSGDVGRYAAPIMRDPAGLRAADILLMESTYGDRFHGGEPVAEQLASIVRRVAEERACLLIPAFAVGRTQDVLYLLGRLEEEKRIPVLPVFVDSPMAADATEIYARHSTEFDAEALAVMRRGASPLRTRRTRFVASRWESQALNAQQGPLVIISASGMATGGRVLHHLRHRLPQAATTVLLVGFQAAGTRGRRLLDGAPEIKMFGELVPVRAKVEVLHGLSAHADQGELLRWIEGFERAPRVTYMVHGEPDAAAAMAERIRERFGWNVSVASFGQHVPL